MGILRGMGDGGWISITGVRMNAPTEESQLLRARDFRDTDRRPGVKILHPPSLPRHHTLHEALNTFALLYMVAHLGRGLLYQQRAAFNRLSLYTRAGEVTSKERCEKSWSL